MRGFGNTAISASAGTGKTWALSHRYLALMAAGVAPDHICALTFSRKAAGEIYESIVERLCAAASDDAQRALTRQSMEAQIAGLTAPAGAAEYIACLRCLLDTSHRLRIGTLDSFLLGIVRAFPLELGVPPDCRPMDNEGSEAVARRQALLMDLYDPGRRPRAGDDDMGAALLNAFHEATFGKASKGLARTVERQVEDYYEIFLRHRCRDWAQDVDVIWPGAGRWWDGFTADDCDAVHDPEFENTLRQALGNDALVTTCLDTARTAADYNTGSAWPETLDSKVVFTRLLQEAHNPAPPMIAYNRKTYEFPGACWPGMRAALANMMKIELDRTVAQTRGVRALLERYDVLYREAQRTDGGMTFSDVTRLLCVDGQMPSRIPGEDRLYIDYRLDGQLDHWLLDEFQDTSDEQWGAIANLVEEVVQDDSRSFFYVGDIKQSIYGWRNGNWRLFERVRNRFGIESIPMRDCYRSRPAIISTVNDVFGGLREWAGLQKADRAPHADAVSAFIGDAWPEHVSKTQPDDGDGFAALLEYEKDKRGEDVEDPAPYRAVVNVLKEIPFQERGLEVAVLVRKNDDGKVCADTLRRHLKGCPVVHEGVGGIVDSPVVTVLLALVQYAAHPGDSLARRHLQMSPLAQVCFEDYDGESFSQSLLALIHEDGFSSALRHWGDVLISTGAIDAEDTFGRQRLREFLASAEVFDATGSRDVDAFIDHIRKSTVKAQAAGGAVRVMTVHQSKGLGFDVVIVPFAAAGRSFASAGSTKLLMNAPNAGAMIESAWVLKPPRASVLEATGGAPLEAIEAARMDGNFDQLCALYVSLTRAKAALYMIIPEAGRSSSTLRDADLLRDRLGDGCDGKTMHGLKTIYATGDDAWYEGTTRAAGTARPEPVAVDVPFVPVLVRREPSKEHMQGTQPAAWLFKEEAGDVPAFGQALHRLFEGVEWLEDVDIELLLADWRGRSSESAVILDDVEQQFRHCVESEDARVCLCRPPKAQAQVWREAPFSFVRQGVSGQELITGRFDRVMIERDEAGQATGAVIVDFKSNRVETEAEVAQAAAGYAEQMRDYVEAAAELLGLPASRVSAVLLFTRIGLAVSV